MGANASTDSSLRAALQEGLREPLLRGRAADPRRAEPAEDVRGQGARSQQTPCEETGGWRLETGRGSACSCPGSQLSAPQSFKAAKPRKTKDFIGSERRQEETGRPRDVPPDVDPLLLDDSDTQPITAKVAALIYRYIEEGNSTMAMQGPDGDEFHEAHFLQRRCCGCFPRRHGVPSASVDAVFNLMHNVAGSLYFCKQVLVLCAVYVERLLQADTSVVLTDGNWRSVVVVGLLVASKVWEDVHPWNADFEECLWEVAGMRYRRGALYHLESLFLEKLGWRVFVDGEVYAKYFFSLLEGSRPGTVNEVRRPVRERLHTDTFTINTIMEEEMYFGGEGDLERGAAERASPCVMPRETASPPGDVWSNPSSSPPCSPTLARLPWSREELASSWRRQVLQEGDRGDVGGARLRAIRDAWQLDKNNPHIGALRHAPCALAPSAAIPQSANVLWAHELAAMTTDMLGPPTARDRDSASQAAAATLSGATGVDLARELRQYLDGRRESKGAA